MIKSLIETEVQEALEAMGDVDKIPDDLKEDITTLIASKYEGAVAKKIKVAAIKTSDTKFGIRHAIDSIILKEDPSDNEPESFHVFGEGFLFKIGDIGFIVSKKDGDKTRIISFRGETDSDRDRELTEEELAVAFSEFPRYDPTSKKDRCYAKGILSMRSDGFATMLEKGKGTLEFKIYDNTTIYPSGISLRDLTMNPIITNTYALLRTYKHKGEIRASVVNVYIFSDIKRAEKKDVTTVVDKILGKDKEGSDSQIDDPDDEDVNLPTIDI